MIGILNAYAGGNFTSRLSISPHYDTVDAVAESINMLGEELKAITISRDYFNNIFHSVSEMIFVLDRSGTIVDTNNRVYDRLGFQKQVLLNKKLDELLDPGKKYFTTEIIKELKKNDGRIRKDYHFKTYRGSLLPVRISASYLMDNKKKKSGILLIAEDRTSQIENDNRVIRAIIDTQEEERRRLSKDLHDSLGQELIGIKFTISSMREASKNKSERRLLQRSDQAMDDIIHNMRDICFNLLPKTLDEFGLLKAVRELCINTELNNKITVAVEAEEPFPQLSKEMAIDLFRVIQEFIHNAIRHGQSSYISMRFKSGKDRVFISLQDNGRGFPVEKVIKGMGLQNAESRIKSHKGEIIIESGCGKGTRFKIMVPVTG